MNNRSSLLDSRRLLSGLLMLGSISTASALDAYIVGPRALGMGGTGVASTDDQTAQFYNPALFGFFGRTTGPDNQGLANKHWGGGFDANVGARIHGNLPEIVELLDSIDVERLRTTGITQPEDVRSLVNMASALNALIESTHAVNVEGTAGISVRIGHAALGVRGFGQAATFVTGIDLVNVALNATGSSLATSINTSGSTTDNQVTLLSSTQRDSLYAALGGAGAFNANSAAGDAVERIDYEMRQAGITGTQIDTAVTVLQNAATNAGQGINENETVFRVRGFGLVEVPLSYGWAIDDHWAIGGSIKLLFGSVAGTQISVYEDGSLESLESTPDNTETTVNWGIDLSIAGRWQWFQAGLIGRNLNSPTFDGFTQSLNGQTFVVDDVKVEPQLAVGLAFIPWSWLTIALDADLLPGQTSFTEYETQRIGGGIEINPWNILALRFGVFQNIAESDLGPVITLGTGLNLWAVRIDLAVASSTEMIEVEEYKIPEEVRASLGLTVDF